MYFPYLIFQAETGSNKFLCCGEGLMLREEQIIYKVAVWPIHQYRTTETMILLIMEIEPQHNSTKMPPTFQHTRLEGFCNCTEFSSSVTIA